MEQVSAKVQNVLVYNSYYKKFVHADVYIQGENFYYIDRNKSGDLKADHTIDGTGKYMIPGLVDIHMHIESSMMTPEPFCRRLASCGVTTIVAEPHEIANVKGIEGIFHMIEAGKQAAIDVFYGIPSSVPSTGEELETTGAVIDFAAMKKMLDWDRVVCVGEVMNYRQIIKENDLEIKKFITYLQTIDPNYPIEGHCPSLVDLELAKFLYLGINGDHTEHTLEEIRQRFENGMFVELQEKMLKPEIFEEIEANQLYEHFGFVTDDVMADELCENGHLDQIIRKAIYMGMKPENAIYACTYTNAMRMNLRDRGSVAPGKLADFILLSDLKNFTIDTVYKNGKIISDDCGKENAAPYSFPDSFYHSVIVKDLKEQDFIIPVSKEKKFVCVNVMEVRDGSTQTTWKTAELPVENGRIKWEESGLLLAAVMERHGKNGGIGYGFVSGDCIRHGAVATTYFHDHHNLLVLGDCRSNMLAAAKQIQEMQGGIVTVKEGKVSAELALPVCGILSDEPSEVIGNALKNVRESLIQQGYNHYNPIMSLCTLGLPVSPQLKLTDKGLVDVKNGKLVSLWT